MSSDVAAVGGAAMPIELIAAWLVREAYKLIVVPVASDVRRRIDDKLSEKITATVSARLFHDHALESHDDATGGSDADAGLTADLGFVDTIEKAPEDGEVLSAEMGRMLGVQLGATGVKRGTDGWYVSAYAAILWRIAMLAVWEDRPIAIQGALQGQEWLTVCVPRVGSVIDPSRMWRQPEPRTLLRHFRDGGPADFFVRQIEDESVRGHDLAALNEQFMIDPNAAFEPADTESVADGWHRVDGISRKWVLLKPDADAEQAILSRRPQRRWVVEPVLGHNPPAFKEYPAEWQPLLKIGSEQGGIVALSAGADEFARASEASAVAVEAAFDDLGPSL